MIIAPIARETPDYTKTCRQTVTLYNVYRGAGGIVYHKTVFEGSAYLEAKRVWQESKTGVKADNQHLFVVPQGASKKTYVDPVEFDALADKKGYFTLRKGDKVMPGTGPDVSDSAAWGTLITSKVPGVVEIATADVRRNLAGKIVHVEAGG